MSAPEEYVGNSSQRLFTNISQFFYCCPILFDFSVPLIFPAIAGLNLHSFECSELLYIRNQVQNVLARKRRISKHFISPLSTMFLRLDHFTYERILIIVFTESYWSKKIEQAIIGKG